ncbi:MAG: hypothetical protein ACO4AJ_03045 [Prochlorothrix sp.]|nr:hypothetical protein [Prochlorothrix sp.]
MNRDNTATANRNEVNRNDHSIPIARNPDRMQARSHGIPIVTRPTPEQSPHRPGNPMGSPS